mgnify:FL=1|jgi:ElaB/YqjD/DUF883 family membrane-anchored ribosome-binding protein
MAKASNKDDTGGGEVDILKEDIEKLRDDLGSLLSDVGSFSRERLTETRDRLRTAAGAMEGRAYDRVQGTARMARDRGYRAVDSSRGAVEDKPLTYVVAAFVAGMILGSLFEWKRP